MADDKFEQIGATTMLAWHFTDGNKLRNGDPLPANGQTLVSDGPLVMLESGLHASIDLLDALRYAPGTMCSRVKCGGTIVRGDDKLVCSERTILWRVEAGAILRAFARWCALQVIDEWEPPEVVLEYLHSGDIQIRSAARSAAWSAARSAAWSAQNKKLTDMMERYAEDTK